MLLNAIFSMHTVCYFARQSTIDDILDVYGSNEIKKNKLQSDTFVNLNYIYKLTFITLFFRTTHIVILQSVLATRVPSITFLCTLKTKS